MNKKLRIALIYGSNREGRFADVIGNWVQTQLKNTEAFDYVVVDPKGIDFPSVHQKPMNGDMNQMGQVLENADAFIILVPEYNHSFPAALKFIIDSFYTPWRVKPIAFVSYGGASGGIRAVEQLRQVFVEMHAVCIRAGVTFPNAWSLFNQAGQLAAGAVQEKAFQTLLLQMEWWGRHLKVARYESNQAYKEIIK